MSCTTCTKVNVLKTKEMLGLLPSQSFCFSSWTTLRLPGLNRRTIYEKKISDTFIRETEMLLKAFDLIGYLKEMASDDETTIVLLCAIAACGLLNAPEDDANGT